MRIGFDARMIDHPGIGRYIKNLLNAMLKLNTKHEFIIFGNKKMLSAFSSQLSANQIINYNAPIYSLKEQLFYPFNKHNLDLLHVPHFNIPYFYTGKLIVTIHDLIYLIFPDSVPSKLAFHYTKIMMARCITKAAGILAVSNNTKKDILNFFKNALEKNINVIYEAADRCFGVIDDKDRLNNIRKKYKLPEKFIFFAGSLKYHKNLKTAIDAFIKIKKMIPDVCFVATGRINIREACLDEAFRASRAIYLGEVDASELVYLYNLASVYLHPSLYEGFGLTVLEAMACGVPVVCSNTSSLPEIAKEAAFLIDPKNSKEITNAIMRILTDTGFRESLIEKGLKRVEEFSWYKAAAETVKIYEAV